MAAIKPPYENVAELMADLDELLAGIPGHPVDWLVQELGDAEKKRAFANAAVKIMLEVDPEFPRVRAKGIDLDRALQVEAGDPGIAHVLMLGIDKVANSMMSVWWHGKSPPAKLIKWLKRSWLEGLDTTQRSFKLCVGRETCSDQVSNKLMFAGYGGGSTLGAAQTLGMLLFLQLPKDLRATPGAGLGRGSGRAPGPSAGPAAQTPGQATWAREARAGWARAVEAMVEERRAHPLHLGGLPRSHVSQLRRHQFRRDSNSTGGG